jgi:hypothetical protein
VVEVVSWLADDGYDIAVGGLSGGAWTTVVTAAVDPRMRLSIPVAGSAPGFREPCFPGHVTEACKFLDFEQRELFHVAHDYDTLYVLGASGSHRAQLAIYNLHDPCFPGRPCRMGGTCSGGAPLGRRRWEIFREDRSAQSDALGLEGCARLALRDARDAMIRRRRWERSGRAASPVA